MENLQPRPNCLGPSDVFVPTVSAGDIGKYYALANICATRHIYRPIMHGALAFTNATYLPIFPAFTAFSESSDAGGQLNIMAAGESGMFSTVRAGVEAGGRPLGADGLQTFGGMRALARYVKIEVVPANEGSVVINEASVVFRAWGTVATFVCGLV